MFALQEDSIYSLANISVDPPSVGKQSNQGESTKGVTEAAVWDAWVSHYVPVIRLQPLHTQGRW